ncbi:MAG: NAD-dependent epimerase/dehydratase family protein [Chloroflexota bacterium]|nr:NAD-dependent epimerase/dehydratase family protein [Chloroflexota bacterium]
MSTGFKHAFVTGATGIVGSRLCERLSELGIRVTAYSRTASRRKHLEGVSYVYGDVRDPETLMFASQNVDVIFHLASSGHNSYKTFEEYRDVNVKGTENVAELAGTLGAKLIHVSTVNVEGFRSGELKDSYAHTKSQAEDLIHAAVAGGLDAVIMRPATVFGNSVGRAGMIVDRILKGSLNVLPAPARLVSPVWVDDLASALINAVDLGQKGQTYTVAGPTIKTSDFVKSVCTLVGASSPLIWIPSWVLVPLIRLAWWSRRIIRWAPPVSVESIKNDSVYDGRQAASDLRFIYTPLCEIFSNCKIVS